MFGAIGQIASFAKQVGTAGLADTPAAIAETPKDSYDFGLQRWMKKRGKFYRPNLSASETQEYQDAFRIIDLDGSGTLEVDELVQAMHALDQPVSVADITKVMHLIAPGKDYLNQTDFIELVHYRSLPTATTKQKNKQAEKETGEGKPKKVQISMGILAGTFRRKKALELLMSPWEVRNNVKQEMARQSELAGILISQPKDEQVGPQKIVHRSPKAAKVHDGTSPSAAEHDLQEDLDYTEHLLSMPLLPPGLSKKLRNEAIRRTIPTKHSVPLMSRIEDKIKTEVALETMEITKTDFYLPPVHKRRHESWIENVDPRSLSPKTEFRSRASGLIEQDEFVRQKKMLLKKYNFPSDTPFPRTPREMQETYAFTAQQLIDTNEASVHAKQRDKRGAKKGHADVDVGQVLKNAQTLLQTAKLALRHSRLQMRDSVTITPTRGLESGARSASPSSLSTSPNVVTPERHSSNHLNNSPSAPSLNAINAIKKTTPNQFVKNHTGPMIRIFKAELAPLPNHRQNVKTVDIDSQRKELGSAKLKIVLDAVPMKADLIEADSAPQKKTSFEMEKAVAKINHNP